jgi:pimeloyl-ACP methyl ester carboxylesterase
VTEGQLVVGWLLALWTAGLGLGRPGLHALPRLPRVTAIPVGLVAVGLLGWAVAREARLALIATLPVGVFLGVALATLVPRRPDGWWRLAPHIRGEELSIPGHEDAGALLLCPAGVQPAEGVCVVLAHGGGNDRLYGLWYLVDALVMRGHSVIAAHLPGHGKGGTDLFSLDAGRQRLDALVAEGRRRAAGRRLVLLGQSLGGALVLDLLVRHGEVDACVTVSAPSEVRLRPAVVAELRALLRAPIYRALAYANPAEALPAAGAFKRASFPVRVPAGQRYIDLFARAVAELDLLRSLGEASVACPTLLVHGAADGVVPVAQSHALAEALGDRAELRVLPGVTHLEPLLDRDVVGQVLTWIEGH